MPALGGVCCGFSAPQPEPSSSCICAELGWKVPCSTWQSGAGIIPGAPAAAAADKKCAVHQPVADRVQHSSGMTDWVLQRCCATKRPVPTALLQLQKEWRVGTSVPHSTGAGVWAQALSLNPPCLPTVQDSACCHGLAVAPLHTAAECQQPGS
jgi:hypothetical protein